MLRYTAIPLLVILLFTACEFMGDESPEPPRELTGSEAQIAKASGAFGLNLLQAVHEEDAGENIFISPLSVSMALGMTLNGAEGETRQEMEEVLTLAGLSRAEINQNYQSLIELLTGMDPKVTMKIANSIWAREGFPVEQEFIDTNQEYFNARVESLDFNDDGAADIMNAWVEENTDGLIAEIVETPIDPLTMMFLINAIYFQGDWTYQFDPDDTKPRPFYLASGQEVEVETMRLGETDLHVYHDDGVTAVDLPYGDEYYSMTLMLPGEEMGMETFIADLGAQRWAEIDGGLSESSTEIQLPKFELEYKIGLIPSLKRLGIEAAFQPGLADFSGINPEAGDLHISDVQHKTFVSVDEEGTEAAAVTSVTMGITSVNPTPPIIRFNRPFAFFIRDHHSGSIIFAGTMMDPSS